VWHPPHPHTRARLHAHTRTHFCVLLQNYQVWPPLPDISFLCSSLNTSQTRLSLSIHAPPCCHTAFYCTNSRNFDKIWQEPKYGHFCVPLSLKFSAQSNYRKAAGRTFMINSWDSMTESDIISDTLHIIYQGVLTFKMSAFHCTKLNAISLKTVRKVQSFLHRLSRHSRMQSGSLAQNFTKFGSKCGIYGYTFINDTQ